MKRDRTVVTKRTVTRYYIYGKGFNSALDAHIQIAKHCVDALESEAWNSARLSFAPFAMKERREFSERWFAARYPAREGCCCTHCSGLVVTGVYCGRGCWVSRMAEYRQIALEIMSGVRDDTGRPLLALPASTEVPVA